MRHSLFSFAMIALVAFLQTIPAFSQAKTDSLKLTCAQAQALVKQRGRLLLATGPRKFDLVVKAQNFCPIGERAVPYRTATSDKRSCNVGKVCRGFSGSDE